MNKHTLKSKTLVFSLVVITSIFNNIFNNSLLAQTDVLISSIKKELNRSMLELKKEELPPYFLSYYVTETINTTINSSFGKLIRGRDRASG